MSADETPDAASSVDLRSALERVLPALEQHLAADTSDPGAAPDAAWRALLDEPVPQKGRGAETTLERLADPVVRHGQRMTSPGFLGWITVGPPVVPAVARLATTLMGTQRYLGHSGNLLEEVGLRWLAEVCGLDEGVRGVFSSGGSVASLLALGAARQAAYERLGHDPARDGMAGLPRGRVYGSSELHHCLLKSAGVLGLGRDGVVLVDTDARHRVDVAALRRHLAEDVAAGIVPVAVVAIAGTTNTGAVDPVAEVADVAEEFGAWLHVDGAYGLFGRLDPEVADQFAGVERADSVVVDPHKWLAVPTSCGATFVRDGELLGRAFTGEPSDYIEGAFSAAETASSPWASMGAPYHEWSLELTAPARGVVVWAALHEIGVDGLRDRVVRHNAYARRVAELAEADERLEVRSAPELSICCFRYRRDGLDDLALDRLNGELLRRMHAESPYVPSGTWVDGRFAIRPCFINPRTTQADVDGMVACVRHLGDAL
ncbi:MAG: pyridoxal phosphate-dependent decarboxylase family protein [Actinomycetes bacterium]